VRRRPDTFWLWIVLNGGGLGALVYIVAEVVPDTSLLRGPLKAFPRRRRTRLLEAAIVDNPAIGNREELADLYLKEGRFERARELYNSIISPHTETIDPFIAEARRLRDPPAPRAKSSRPMAARGVYASGTAVAEETATAAAVRTVHA